MGDQGGEAAVEGAARDPDFVTALARGLDVLACFDANHRDMTLSEVADRTGLTRGTARRFLLTLETLGFVRSDGKRFRLAAKVLTLGDAYLTSFGVGDRVRTILEHVAASTGEASSVAVLEGPHAVYIARANAPRAFATSLTLGVGSRLPAHCSSLGRVLLAALDEEALTEWLSRYPLTPWTDRTITDPAKLRLALATARQQGYAIVTSEMELGLRSLSVPVQGPRGRTLAALNTATLTARTPLDQLRRSFLPVLRSAAAEIGQLLERR